MRSLLAATFVLSSLFVPTMASAATPAPESAAAQPIRVSTGVTTPTLLTPISLNVPSSLTWEILPNDAKVELKLVVDEKGNAHDVQVTRSLTPFWDARVVEAVSKALYRPASIDQQNIPMAVNLTVSIAR